MTRGGLLGVGLAVGLVAGCGKKEADLVLFCGAGIRPPAAKLVETFEREHGVSIVTDYAGAAALISRIKLNRQGDLYMPGDRQYVDVVAKEGLILSQRSVCYFVPTILVQKGNPLKIAGLRDLVKPGVKLGLGDPRAVPIGRNARKIFEKNHILWANVESNLKFQSATVNELGIQIQAKSLDAVIVWDAIATYYAAHGDEVPIPVEQNVISTVSIGVLSFTKNRELAEQFVAFAASDRGRAILEEHNYRVDAPQHARLPE